MGLTALIGLISQTYSFTKWAVGGIQSFIIELNLRSKYAELEKAVSSARLTPEDIVLITKRIDDHVKKTKKIEEESKETSND